MSTINQMGSRAAYYVGRGLINMACNRIFWTLAAATASSYLVLDAFRAQIPNFTQLIWAAGWVLAVGLIIGLLQAHRLDRKGYHAKKELSDHSKLRKSQIDNNVQQIRKHLADQRATKVSLRGAVLLILIMGCLGTLEHFNVPFASSIMKIILPVLLVGWFVAEAGYFWPKVSDKMPLIKTHALKAEVVIGNEGRHVPTLNTDQTPQLDGAKESIPAQTPPAPAPEGRPPYDGAQEGTEQHNHSRSAKT